MNLYRRPYLASLDALDSLDAGSFQRDGSREARDRREAGRGATPRGLAPPHRRRLRGEIDFRKSAVHVTFHRGALSSLEKWPGARNGARLRAAAALRGARDALSFATPAGQNTRKTHGGLVPSSGPVLLGTKVDGACVCRAIFLKVISCGVASYLSEFRMTSYTIYVYYHLSRGLKCHKTSLSCCQLSSCRVATSHDGQTRI